MNSNSSNDAAKLGVEELIEEQAGSKPGDQRATANEGKQAGPTSNRGGQPISPQMGDPRARDRRPN